MPPHQMPRDERLIAAVMITFGVNPSDVADLFAIPVEFVEDWRRQYLDGNLATPLEAMVTMWLAMVRQPDAERRDYAGRVAIWQYTCVADSFFHGASAADPNMILDGRFLVMKLIDDAKFRRKYFKNAAA